MEFQFSRTASPELVEFLLPTQREDLQDALSLCRTLSASKQLSDENPNFADYAFVVFPAARAYEGFLKLFFRSLNILSDEMYRDKYFRVGRSFNPDISEKFRDQKWIFDDVSQICGKEVATELWQTWLAARNHLFHFFPDSRYQITLPKAEELVGQVIDVMNRAIASVPAQK